MQVKPTYRQSQIYNYFSCPYRFELSRKHEMPCTAAMKDGRLYEAMVLGAKDDSEYQELFAGKRPKTMEAYERSVADIKRIFGQGEPYKKMTMETPHWILQGEADFVGTVTILGKTYRTIADLKFTGNISKVWMEKTEKKDFLQAPFYQLLWYRLTGELLPFTYITVANDKGLPDGVSPIMKPYILMPNEKSLDWVISLVDSIHGQSEYFPNMNACEDGFYRSRCKYLDFCKYGRSTIECPVEVDFEELQ